MELATAQAMLAPSRRSRPLAAGALLEDGI